MLARPLLGDRNGRDAFNMQAQGRQFPKFGPEDAMRKISELESKLAAATNRIVQSKANSEKHKAALHCLQANWEKQNAKLTHNENFKPD